MGVDDSANTVLAAHDGVFAVEHDDNAEDRPASGRTATATAITPVTMQATVLGRSWGARRRDHIPRRNHHALGCLGRVSLMHWGSCTLTPVCDTSA